MTQLLLWFILNYGLMNIMVYGSIFQGLRDRIKKWGDNPYAIFNSLGAFISGILSCPMCFSFHGGWFTSLLIFSPTHEILGLNSVISWFFDGILSSGAVWVINSVVEWFEENRPNQNNVI